MEDVLKINIPILVMKQFGRSGIWGREMQCQH